MSFIVDRLILILLSFFIMYEKNGSVSPVIALLVTVFFAAVNSYFENRKLIASSTVIYATISFFFSPLVCMSPVIIYDAVNVRSIVAGVLFIASLIVNFGDFSVDLIMYFILMIMLGIVLNYKSRKNEALTQMVKQVRDDGQEKRLLLADKNKHLIEKQDYEVYVATLKERNRIARDIHDNVGHVITRSILQMGALMTINKDEPLHGQLTSVKENLDCAMNNIRQSVHDLHDESIDLEQSVKELTAELTPRFKCSLNYDIASKLERNYKYAIIGIIKEAVSNIMKHSKNDMVDIILREHPGMYQLVIHDYDGASYNKDNGYNKVKNGSESVKGKPVDLISTSGIGIQNIRDRVAGLQGHVVISADNGFKIFVTLPRNME